MNRLKSLSVCGVVSILALTGSSEVLTWTGKYSDVWDLTEKNWTNSVGEEVAFVDNSDALFDDNALCFSVRFTNNAVHAGHVVFDTAGIYSLTNNGSRQYLYSATSIRKRGNGQLNAFPQSSVLIYSLTEGIFVDEGTATFTGQQSLTYLRQRPDIVFFAGTNATLHFATRNIFNADMTETVTTPVVIKNGTFKASDINGHLKVGPIALDNSTFDFSELRGYNGYGIMTFSGKLTFKGSTPYELLQQDFLQLDTNEKYRHFSLWSEPKTEFCVDEISGDGAEDVIIGAMLCDHCTNHNPVVMRTHGGLIKSGSGTLALTNALNTFSGDIVVQEGILQVGPNWQLNSSSLVSPSVSNSKSDHWLGCLTNKSRRIVVKSGASLYFPNRNCFGSQGGITNLCTNINITLVFDGGAFTNYEGQGFMLPNVEFSNGGSVAPGTGPNSYGRFMVKEFFTVKGNVPFEWNLSSGAHGNVSRMTQEALSINGSPENVFDIADVTDDSDPDATFGIPFIIGYGYFRSDTADGDHYIDDWKFGFRKTGLGTMRITAPKLIQTHKSTKSGRGALSINGDPKVEEGELRVDGDLSLSDTVRVYEGAYLSGTGLVNNVSIAQGGGLRVRDGQTAVLRIGGDLSVEGGLKIDVLLADGADVRDVKAKVLTVSGEIEGAESLVSASVFVDGVSVPNIKLRLDDGALSLRYMRGTTVVFR